MRRLPIDRDRLGDVIAVPLQPESIVEARSLPVAHPPFDSLMGFLGNETGP
jgi:hypothetical protein